MKKLYHYLETNLYYGLFAGTFVPLADMTSSSKLGDLYSSGSLATYFQKLFDFSIALGAIIAVVRLMQAGYYYMGSDVVGNKGTAKSIFSDVFLGLFLLLGAWILLNQINPDILKMDVLKNMTPIQQSSSNSNANSNAPSTFQNAPYSTGPTPTENLSSLPLMGP